MSSVASRLSELGLQLPPVPAPVAAYVPAVRLGPLVFTSGQLPMISGELQYRGSLGAELSTEEGYQAARIAALNALAAAAAQVGGIEHIERILKVTGYVRSAAGFQGQAQVMNGASDLLASVFSEAGTHARSAVGVAELPLGSAVEVELIVVSDQRG